MLRLLAQMLTASHKWKGCGAMAMLCDGHVTNHRQCGLDLHCAPLAAKVGYTVAVWLRLDQPLPPQGASAGSGRLQARAGQPRRLRAAHAAGGVSLSL